MSHVFYIVLNQDSYVLLRGQAIWKSVAKNPDFFLATNLGWRSANATRKNNCNSQLIITIKIMKVLLRTYLAICYFLYVCG